MVFLDAAGFQPLLAADIYTDLVPSQPGYETRTTTYPSIMCLLVEICLRGQGKCLKQPGPLPFGGVWGQDYT